jgi:radical SAM superfamily enzyme YgiQ (UPF0313 family)
LLYVRLLYPRPARRRRSTGDAPAAGLTLDDVLPLANRFDMAVLHTSSPSFAGDVRVAEAFKRANPKLVIGFVGAKVAVDPDGSLLASPGIDFVAREEFDFSIAEIAEGRPWAEVDGVTFRDDDGAVVHNPDRAIVEDMDLLPWVSPVYQRDLNTDDDFIGYLKHPYVSLYTGRGCRSQCTFCLWPQTVGGHRYRTRSVENVLGEMTFIKGAFPRVKEIFFDDDTFTDSRERAEEIAMGMGKLGLTWSCNAKANVPYHRIDDHGLQSAVLEYPSLSRTEIYDSVETFYKKFYFRAGKIAEMSAEMLRSPEMMRRRLREGAEFVTFLRKRKTTVGS